MNNQQRIDAFKARYIMLCEEYGLEIRATCAAETLMFISTISPRDPEFYDLEAEFFSDGWLSDGWLSKEWVK